jgi:hypothetical protein
MKQASMTQVHKSKDGHMVAIDQDLLEIIRQVKELDPNLSIRWSVEGEYFGVYERNKMGKDELVFTTTELDQRVVERLRFISSKHYSYVEEIDKLDREFERDKDHKFAEEVGERGEHLAHALRKDLQAKNKIILPRGVQ